MYLCNIPRVETGEIGPRFDMAVLIVHRHGTVLFVDNGVIRKSRRVGPE